MLVEVSAL
jgi:hypothetical protein